MKTPDEIKKGFELCTLSYAQCVLTCPYAGDDCIELLVTDALALIQQKEEAIAKKDRALVELARVASAAIEDMKEMAQYVADDVCTWCDQKNCKGCAGVPTNPNFKWRGVQKED